MLARRAHFWLCCMPGQMEDFEERLSGTPIRTQRAKEPMSRFGPYDYIFIDGPTHDAPIDLVLQSLLGTLEPHADMMLGLEKMLAGVRVEVASSSPKYSEAIDSETLGRLARLRLGITLSFEHVPEDATRDKSQPT